jgi:hypothetical protein
VKATHLVLLVIACPLEFVINLFGLNKEHNPLMSNRYLISINRWLWWVLALSLPIFGLTQDGWAHQTHTGPPYEAADKLA